LKLLRFIVVLSLAAGIAGYLLTPAPSPLIHLGRVLARAFLVVTPTVLLLVHFGTRMYRVRSPWNWTLIAATILVCVLAGNLAWHEVAPNQPWTLFWYNVRISALLALSFGIGAVVFGTLRTRLESTTLELRNRELEQERAQKLAVEAQLASLESYIRPHFLFNTLNTISSLIPDDPRLAESLVGKLASMLRYSLDSNHQRTSSLERELQIVADYVEIERARHGNRLRFHVDVPPEFHAIEIPALALQTLIENSAKHAAGSRFEGADIRISVFKRNKDLFVQVTDDGPGFDPQAIPAGHGLDNLRRRLIALFGPDATLEIDGRPGACAVAFRVPAETR
jgi:sensor histidine kinase YesM